MTNIDLPETHYPLTCRDLHNAMFDDDWNDVPYLRPLSSMTEEEKVEYYDLQKKFLLSSHNPVTNGFALYDWLNKKMFDFRGLIPKGLAISTEKFNPYKD